MKFRKVQELQIGVKKGRELWGNPVPPPQEAKRPWEMKKTSNECLGILTSAKEVLVL